MFRLGVFDLDGTLVDSQRDLANAANALVRELGGAPIDDDDVAAMVGEGAAVLVRRVLTAAGLDPATHDALPRFLDLYDERLADYTVPYNGIEQVLTRLQIRMPLAVLTNKPQRPTDRLLSALGLSEYFTAVVGGDTSLGRKPNPAGLLQLCERAHVAPNDAVLVGDSPIDLQTARNAGTAIALARYGFGFRFAPEELTGIVVANTPEDVFIALSR
jgi:phosphoglycolate phosphatase